MIASAGDEPAPSRAEKVLLSRGRNIKIVAGRHRLRDPNRPALLTHLRKGWVRACYAALSLARMNSYRSIAAATPTSPECSGLLRNTRPKHRTRTGPAWVNSCGRVMTISTGEPLLSPFGKW